MGDRPRRVAYVLTQDAGGPVDVTVQLALAVSAAPGWEVRLFGPLPARDAARVAHLHTEVLVEGKAAARAIGRARSTIRAWQPDVVHAQDRRSGLVSAGLSWRSRGGGPSAVLHTYHGVPDDVGERWFRDGTGDPPSAYTRAVLAADAAVARCVTRTVVPSASMGAFLRDRLRVPARRVVHIDNGLVLPPAAPPSGPVRRLLFAGLLVARKGVHVLLDAVAAADLPDDVQLTIAGDGPERAALEERARRLGLAHRVSFLGFSSDVPRLLAESDALVLPSMMEQQPLVLIEAMGAGKPVLATDVGGVREAVGDAGLVVRAGDAGALADALARLVADDGAAALGARAARRARERFTVRRCAEQHTALYASLLGA